MIVNYDKEHLTYDCVDDISKCIPFYMISLRRDETGFRDVYKPYSEHYYITQMPTWTCLLYAQEVLQ